MTILISAFLISLASASLKADSDRLGLRFGTATNANQFNDQKYMNILSAEFNMMTAEYECKPQVIRASKDKYDYSLCERSYNIAFERNSAFRGHTLVWREYTPAWYSSLGASELKQEMLDYVSNVMKQFKGKIKVWDVVNEALADSYDNDRIIHNPNIYYEKIPNYVDLAFTAARQADPTTRLFYNDYDTHNMEYSHAKNQLNFIRDLVNRRIPIDGIGFQCHIKSQETVTKESILAAFAPYIQLGLEIQITELDVECGFPCDDTALQKQANVYLAITQACVETPSCTAIITWGVVDSFSWRSQQTIIV